MCVCIHTYKQNLSKSRSCYQLLNRVYCEHTWYVKSGDPEILTFDTEC